MRRAAGTILPLEASILAIAAGLGAAEDGEFHGFAMAKQLREVDTARRLTAHGTLYKALARMEKAGWLASRWEDPAIAADDARPRRRLYWITSDGRAVIAALRHSGVRRTGAPGLAPA